MEVPITSFYMKLLTDKQTQGKTQLLWRQ